MIHELHPHSSFNLQFHKKNSTGYFQIVFFFFFVQAYWMISFLSSAQMLPFYRSEREFISFLCNWNCFMNSINSRKQKKDNKYNYRALHVFLGFRRHCSFQSKFERKNTTHTHTHYPILNEKNLMYGVSNFCMPKHIGPCCFM